MDRKKEKAIKELLKILNKDTIDAEQADPELSSIGGVGDINFTFKRKKYPVSVVRKESLPNKTLESEKSESDILMFRKNRKNWKVYMDLNTLISLLLNNRS